MSRHNCTTFRPSVQLGIYTVAKSANLVLADILDELQERCSDNVRMCAARALVRWCPDCSVSHVAGAWCCHHRLCPICQVRRSRRVASSAMDAIALLRSTGRLEGVSFFLLTLTQQNVPDGLLGRELSRLLSALSRLRHTRDFRNFVVGSARNIEITRNYDYHTWHPHVHIVLMLRDGHPAMDTAAYWESLWASLLDLSYRPVIDIRPIVDDGAIYEVSKYVSKSAELLSRLPASDRTRIIGELNDVTRKRILIAYTGIWRVARAELRILDDEFADLEDDSPCKCGGALMHAMMIWRGSEYVLEAIAPDGLIFR